MQPYHLSITTLKKPIVEGLATMLRIKTVKGYGSRRVSYLMEALITQYSTRIAGHIRKSVSLIVHIDITGYTIVFEEEFSSGQAYFLSPALIVGYAVKSQALTTGSAFRSLILYIYNSYLM
uniref:Transposase n=1 Tax=Steinernema glaseri TaxID=37863 RepID=A0A1I7Z244_9BILA